MTTLVTLRAAAASVSGLVRQGNEDAVYAGRWLFAVADGLGGHAAGELASAAVVETLQAYDRDIDESEALKTLSRAVREANAEIARRAAEDPARRGPAPADNRGPHHGQPRIQCRWPGRVHRQVPRRPTGSLARLDPAGSAD